MGWYTWAIGYLCGMIDNLLSTLLCSVNYEGGINLVRHVILRPHDKHWTNFHIFLFNINTYNVTDNFECIQAKIMFQEEQVPNVKTETLNEIVCEEGKHPHVCGDVPENSSLGPKDGTVHYFAGVELSKLSKTQRKKYLRLQKWLLKKKERRERERLISKNRKAEAKLHNIDLGPSSKMLKSNRMCDSPCKITVAIDLSFDELMIPKVKSHTTFTILINIIFFSDRI